MGLYFSNDFLCVLLQAHFWSVYESTSFIYIAPDSQSYIIIYSLQ